MRRGLNWSYFVCCSVLFSAGTSWTPAQGKPVPSSLAPPPCAAELAALTTELLADLPHYANRAHTRLGIPSTYVIVASRPDFRPLPLGPGQRAAVPNSVEQDNPYQLFFTTLERDYQGSGSVQLQLYHWLFLTRTERTWRLALMYSMTGPYPGGYPPSPPQDSSEGSLAQAIRTWLRDYRSHCVSATAPRRTHQD